MMDQFWITFGAVLSTVLLSVQSVLPREYSSIVYSWIHSFLNNLTPYFFVDIPEFYGAGGNEIYEHVETYLSSTSVIDVNHVNACRSKNATQDSFSLAHDATIEEVFQGAKIWWTHSISERRQVGIQWTDTPKDDKRTYKLQIRKRDKSCVVPYLKHVKDVSKSIKESSRDRFLYANLKNRSGNPFKTKLWEKIPYKFPSTFNTLAMDPELKEEIKEDLLDFTKGKEFYEKAGKPWKRGYLLYGPPGTGKSSMIAAMANFLHYDVYEIELTEVASNAELRKLLVQTTDQSIIVIEDIDCSVELVAERAKAFQKNADKPGAPDEMSRVTLSGLLTFTDGLWSSCGRERIIIFTTNYIEKLDKALLREGRMDKHVHMSWCSFPAFQTLAKNNLGLEWHALFPQIEKAITNKAIAPAAVSEILLRRKHHPTAALHGLLEVLLKAKLASEMHMGSKINLDEVESDQSTEVLDDSHLLDDCGSDDSKAKVVDH